MDQDDPEKRIAELERQLADATAAAGRDHGVEQPGAPMSTAETARRPRLTAADIHNVVFSKPPFGKRGYNEDEVDAFLDLIEARLLNPSNRFPTAAEVHNVAFNKPPIGKRGYNEDEVDAFLDLVESEISRLDGTR
jgi:DivIVA domain-containing protein